MCVALADAVHDGVEVEQPVILPQHAFRLDLEARAVPHGEPVSLELAAQETVAKNDSAHPGFPRWIRNYGTLTSV